MLKHLPNSIGPSVKHDDTGPMYLFDLLQAYLIDVYSCVQIRPPEPLALVQFLFCLYHPCGKDCGGKYQTSLYFLSRLHEFPNLFCSQPLLCNWCIAKRMWLSVLWTTQNMCLFPVLSPSSTHGPDEFQHTIHLHSLSFRDIMSVYTQLFQFAHLLYMIGSYTQSFYLSHWLEIMSDYTQYFFILCLFTEFREA